MSLLRQELAELYEDAGQQLFRCAMSVTSSGDLAEDAMHDAFIRAFRLSERPRNLRAYMFRAVRNAAVDIVRRQSKCTQPISDDFFEVPATPVAEPDIDLEKMVETMMTLTNDERETILQHLSVGLSFREIAELRDRPIGTIATWYRRGLEKVRRKMNSNGESRN